MSKQSKSGKAAAKSGTGAGRIAAGIILLAVLLALLGGAIWFILDRTNGGTEDFRTFAVTVDGEELKTYESKRDFSKGEHTVSVAYLFGGDYDYSVEILPESSFNYKTNGAWRRWSDQTELTKAFAIKKEEKSFTFTVPENLTAVLAAIYPDADVVPPQTLQDPYIYTLVITSYNGKNTYYINFGIYVPVGDVEVTPGEVIFPA